MDFASVSSNLLYAAFINLFSRYFFFGGAIREKIQSIRQTSGRYLELA